MTSCPVTGVQFKDLGVKKCFDVDVFLFFFSTACQSSTDRKGGQAVPSLCNQCWGFCGGPTAIPDYSQNVRTLFYCGVKRVEEVDDYTCQTVMN